MRRLLVVLGLCALASPVTAQWLRQPTQGIPRTADGRPDLTAPAPRTSDGRPDLSGLWDKGTSPYTANLTRDLRPDEMQPSVAGLVSSRREDFAKGHMSVQCLPFGPASMTDVAPSYREMKIVQTPTLVVFLFAGLTYRQIHMDGRPLETDPHPSWMGYSVGRWEGDTLVVESSGYNDRTWLDRDGHPHTEKLRVTERYRRRDFGHLDVEMTLHDPAIYARPWTVKYTAEFMPDTEMLEYVCNENQNLTHWVGTRSDDEKAAVAVAPSTLARYLGTFAEQPPTFAGRVPGRVVEVYLREGKLFANLDGRGEVALIAQSETRFVGLTIPVEFVVNGNVVDELRALHVMNAYLFKRIK